MSSSALFSQASRASKKSIWMRASRATFCSFLVTSAPASLDPSAVTSDLVELRQQGAWASRGSRQSLRLYVPITSPVDLPHELLVPLQVLGPLKRVPHQRAQGPDGLQELIEGTGGSQHLQEPRAQLFSQGLDLLRHLPHYHDSRRPLRGAPFRRRLCFCLGALFPVLRRRTRTHRHSPASNLQTQQILGIPTMRTTHLRRLAVGLLLRGQRRPVRSVQIQMPLLQLVRFVHQLQRRVEHVGPDAGVHELGQLQQVQQTEMMMHRQSVGLVVSEQDLRTRSEHRRVGGQASQRFTKDLGGLSKLFMSVGSREVRVLMEPQSHRERQSRTNYLEDTKAVQSRCCTKTLWFSSASCVNLESITFACA
eukprot:scaffold1960_cov242-Pinguiococcus_pyrenoidosus.AAC.7